MSNSSRKSLDLRSLRARYAAGESPARVLRELVEQIDRQPGTGVWIHRLTVEQVMEQLAAAEGRNASKPLPLLGIPFAIKDNIDLAGAPTTAACPDYAYVPKQSATVVQRLIDAGAIVIGKTNLDQFALGLVGTRSPYGACENAFDPRYIAGGSSSGSGIAVAAGMVSFALATDTAGSGRIPCGFNNIVGLKPTKGRLSNAGVVPACQSLDCVSIMALTCADADEVTRIAAGYDPADPYSRMNEELPPLRRTVIERLRIGVPARSQLQFFGNSGVEKIYRASLDRLASLGASIVEIDYLPFADAARMLYEGPWLAERLPTVRGLLAESPEKIIPVTRGILLNGRNFTALDSFDGEHELARLRQLTIAQWKKMDILAVPTAGTIFTLAEVEADPLNTNSKLGYYTNFVNLLDLCALASPAGFSGDGLPVGVTFIAPAGQDDALVSLGKTFARAVNLPLGATGVYVDEPEETPAPAAGVRVAVVGAHLSGQPLNWQLTDRNARLVASTRTAPRYQLYALANTTPPKPGLVQSGPGGTAIELEVWEMPVEAFGSFVAAIPPPLGIGTIALEDGQTVKGFVCEEIAIKGSRNISQFGGWRAFLAAT